MNRRLLSALGVSLLLASNASAQTAAPPRPAENGAQRASRILAILDEVAPSPTHARIQSRTYDFKEAGMTMGYELFVPSTYDARRPTPLIVALHCLQCPPHRMIRYEGLTELAEARGYIVVAPMGVNLHGWYGARGQTGPMSGRREGEPADPENLGALSELDVMNVLGLVRKEFNVDASRIYLMGHSMGGGGTWYLAVKNPTLFAALAVAAPAASGSPDQLAAIRHLPVLVIQGENDELVNVNTTRQWVAKMKELGMTHTYIEVPGGDHMAVIVKNRANMTRIFDLFDQASARSRGSAAAASTPRMPNGRPDLQGMWTNQTLTRLQRPDEFGGRQSVTETEAAKYARDFLAQNNTDRRDGGAQADVSRAYPDYFLDRGTELAIVDNQRRTSLIIDPPSGKIPPLTPAAQARNAARRRPGGDLSNNFDDPETRPLAERCLLSFGSSSGPPMLPVLYNNHYQFVQTPDYLMIHVEMVHDARIIPLDGRSHQPPHITRWLGDSVGRWEGDTLVVDTTNFNPSVSFQGSGPKLHVVERFTRIDADTILYRFTVDDPETFTQQWHGEMPLRATDDALYEYACHEANHSLPSILSGARFQEKQQAEKSLRMR